MAAVAAFFAVLAYRRPRPWRDLAEANEALRQGRHDEAQLRYARYIAKFGGSAGVHFARGIALHRLGRRDEAAQEMRLTLELSATHVDAALYLATAALEHDDGLRALALAHQALGADPHAARAHLIAGRVLATPGTLDVDRARWHLREALADSETSVEARVILAELLVTTATAPGADLGSGEFEEALRAGVEEIARRLADQPDRVALRVLMVRTALLVGDLDRAWEHLESLRRTAPDRGEVRSLEGRLLWLRGAEGEGKRALDAYLESGPGALGVLEVSAFYEGVGRDDLAAAVLRDARRRDPGDLTLRLHEARSMLREGRAADAEAHLRDALVARPGETLIELWLVEALIAQDGRRRAAESLLRDAHVRDSTTGAVDAAVALRLADLLLDPEDGPTPSPGRVEEARTLLSSLPEIVDGSPTDTYLAYVRGKLAVLERRFDEALDHLSHVVERTPDDPFPHLLLARVHEERGEFDLAALELTSAMRRGAGSALLLVRRARARSRDVRSAPETALADARAALELDPTLSEARVLLARAMMQRADGDARAAETLLREGLDLGVEPAPLHLELARLLAAVGRLDEAVAAADAARRTAVDDARSLEALLLRADLEDRRSGVRLSPAARELFERAVRDRPGDVERPLRYAERLLRGGDVAGARRMARSVEQDPIAAPRAGRILFESHVGEGSVPDEARGLAESLVRTAPDSVHAQYVVGKLALLDGRDDEARAALAAAAERAPFDTEVSYFLAVAQLRSGALDAARRTLLHALRVRPQALEPRLLLAEVAARQGRVARTDGDRGAAIVSLRDALRSDPTHVGARGTLIATYLDSWEEGASDGLDRARAECELLLASMDHDDDPRRPVVARLLAAIAEAQDDWETVVATYADIVSRDGDDLDAVCSLADALVIAGRPAEAVDVLERARARHPDAWPLVRRLVDACSVAGAGGRGLASTRSYVAAHPEDSRGHMVVGWLLAAEEQRGPAETALRRALELDPHREGAALALVDLLLVDARADDADTLLASLDAAGASSAALRFQRGRVLLAAGRTDEGVAAMMTVFRDGIDDPMQWAKAAGVLMETLFRTQRDDELTEVARAFAERAREISDPVPGTPATEILADAYRLAGIALQRRSRREEAAHAYDRALRLRSDDTVVLNNSAELIAGDARMRDERERELAVARARRAVELAPGVPEYRDTLGLALFVSGASREAVEQFDIALATLRQRAADAPRGDPRRQAVVATLLRSTEALLVLRRGDEARARLDEAATTWPAVTERRRYAELRRRAERR